MAHAGVDVTFIDAWADNVQAMRNQGITVSGMRGEGSVHTPVRALHISDVSQLVREPPFDIVFIAVKSYDTTWATHLIAPFAAPTGCFVSLQNGINEESMAQVVGWQRVLGCSVSALAAELTAPATIVRNSPLGDDQKWGLRIGEANGQITPRAEAIASLLSHSDSCKVTTNLWGERWSKLTINAMRNGVCALTGLTGRQRDNPRDRAAAFHQPGQLLSAGGTCPGIGPGTCGRAGFGFVGEFAKRSCSARGHHPDDHGSCQLSQRRAASLHGARHQQGSSN